MGMDQGINPSNNKNILPNTAFQGPRLKPVEPKQPDTQKSRESNDSSSHNLAFSINGLSLVSSAEKEQIPESKNTNRSGPGNLPSRSVTYELESADFGDYDDNSFSLS